MSSATEVLLNMADKANISTANITVVSLIPFEDDLFIIDPIASIIFILKFYAVKTYTIHICISMILIENLRKQLL